MQLLFFLLLINKNSRPLICSKISQITLQIILIEGFRRISSNLLLIQTDKKKARERDIQRERERKIYGLATNNIVEEVKKVMKFIYKYVPREVTSTFKITFKAEQ